MQVLFSSQGTTTISVNRADWTAESEWRTAGISWNRGLIVETFSLFNGWYNCSKLALEVHPGYGSGFTCQKRLDEVFQSEQKNSVVQFPIYVLVED